MTKLHSSVLLLALVSGLSEVLGSPAAPCTGWHSKPRTKLRAAVKKPHAALYNAQQAVPNYNLAGIPFTWAEASSPYTGPLFPYDDQAAASSPYTQAPVPQIQAGSGPSIREEVPHSQLAAPNAQAAVPNSPPPAVSHNPEPLPYSQPAVPNFQPAVPNIQPAVHNNQATVPTTQSAGPNTAGAAIPGGQPEAPRYEAVVPDLQAFLNDTRAAVPNGQAAVVANSQAALPQHQAVVPNIQVAGPNVTAGVHNATASVAKARAAVPNPHAEVTKSREAVLPAIQAKLPKPQGTVATHSQCTPMVENFDSSRLSSSWVQLSRHPNATQMNPRGGVNLVLSPPAGPVAVSKDGKTNDKLGDGSTLNSTFSLLYGKVSFTMAASDVRGAVSALVLLGTFTADEIDVEVVGGDPKHWQTNVFRPAPGETEPLYGVFGGVHAYPKDGYCATTHTYTIDWSPSGITWSVDGNVVRTLTPEQTLHNGQRHFPSALSRVQIGLWDASSPLGTSGWANGPIPWSVYQISLSVMWYSWLIFVFFFCRNQRQRKPISATIKSVKVECPY
ncbi:hypothetical protein VP01_1825g1 [Puccinia sorghi]|uniref:GH16 domain-containing protein n=1 Tax=Puccinia sorghi TaxID=27349 RepID=A0A0L6VDW5_9BASI|nr:hypothetical protein VP01_1825g1 [Puccinia sorghi]